MVKKRNIQNKKTPVPKKETAFLVSTETMLMEFLMAKMPEKSRSKIKSLLSSKQVLVDGIPVSQFNHPLVPGQKIEISRQRPGIGNMDELTVVFEDQHIVVIDKQAGLLTISTAKEKTCNCLQSASKLHETKRSLQQNFYSTPP